jgi:hypothetical protein
MPVEQSIPIAVVMERLALNNRWQSWSWEAHGVVPDIFGAGAPPRVLVQDARRLQMLFPGFHISLHTAEAEGYYLNMSAPTPKVFVMWRMRDDIAAPVRVTVSYGEAARMLDSNEQVDAVAMPPDMVEWVADFVNKNYKPQPKTKIRRRDPLAEGGP